MRYFKNCSTSNAASFFKALALTPILCVTVCGQIPMGRPGTLVRIIPTDSAVLEMQEVRKDLPCSVSPGKAPLGFDLKFHAGYEVTVPFRELVGAENLLSIVFRITPKDKAEEPAYFIQRVKVPPIEEGASGDALLEGAFDLGTGKYHVDWLMRDRAERVCSFYWDVEATLPNKDASLTVAIPQSEVRPVESEHFREEPAVERAQNAPINVKVLLNYAPQNAASAAMRPSDITALVSILRSIFRDPRIAKFSLVAFNLHEQKILFRQENADSIDFPSLGEAVSKVKLATVDLARLAQKKGEISFLSSLVQSELKQNDRPDAIVFAGPKAMVDSKIEPGVLKELGELSYPVYYLNYNLAPQAVPWRDAISHAVKYFKGQEFTISKPRDLWFATTEMVESIVRLKHNRAATAAGGGQ